MTPHTLTANELPIFQGAKWEHVLSFVQTGTNTAVNLTGLTPFVCEIRNPQSDTLLATPTCTVATPSNGQVTVSLAASITNVLPLKVLRIGLRDAQNNPYIQGEILVKPFTPDPA
jgi:hypothetical protein